MTSNISHATDTDSQSIATLLQRSLRVAAECDNGDGPWLISGAFQVKDG